MPHDPQAPWLFRRDEIDILEEELDQIWDRHETADPRCHALEEGVLNEQMETEEASEAELALRLGPQWAKEAPCSHDYDRDHATPAFGADSHLPLRELLRRETVRDPLYVRAFQWATQVFHWSQACYTKDEDRSRDVFRVHVNAYLVPVKIAFGQAEEARDDHASLEVAAREFELAATYLSRTRESLGTLLAQNRLTQEMLPTIAEAQAIARALQECRDRLDRRRGFQK